jgi:hypothetical protein
LLEVSVFCSTAYYQNKSGQKQQQIKHQLPDANGVEPFKIFLQNIYLTEVSVVYSAAYGKERIKSILPMLYNAAG